MGNVHTCGPNTALVVSGGCRGGSNRKTTVIGGWAWAWWLVTDVQRLTLEIMTLEPECHAVETIQGVPITVTGVAQIKVMTNPDLLQAALEQFLGKDPSELKRTILGTLEGHLRSILGTMTVEEIYKDRDAFADRVKLDLNKLFSRFFFPSKIPQFFLGNQSCQKSFQVYEVAKPDVGRMGIEILSFTIKDVFDNVEYLSSLGKSRTATVIKDADIGVANSNRDAGIKEAECLKAAMDAKFETDTKIEDDTRAFKLQVAEFEKEVNTAKAQAQLAYQLEAAKLNQKIKSEEIKIDVVVRKKEIEIEEQEILRKEKELKGTVKLPAEAEAFK